MQEVTVQLAAQYPVYIIHTYLHIYCDELSFDELEMLCWLELIYHSLAIGANPLTETFLQIDLIIITFLVGAK